MRKSVLVVFGLLLSLVLVACSNDSSERKEIEDIKEKVHEYSVGNFGDDVTASITSHELIVKDKGKETTYDLPSNEFFVSIAPFITTTHPCGIHSLTGCQGELVKKDFDVFIQDVEGNVVVDETMTSLENGFIDLWLPRDKNFKVKITHDGKTVDANISTFEGDNTCITTMQLT
ncbi:CueP family metal-binding protein [Sporosarcina sp. SAFN-015]|uniref:CueP family metal-binding protein n=1 Tax=Sporosarcina sp. SAFN-015 TaxID=3387274 RepID=UPI003F803C7F